MRFSRQIAVFGDDGQRKLREATVGVVGLGGLGCNVITQLASAGIGNFVIADPEYPDESNLNRQFIYHSENRSKASVSMEWIKRLGSEVTAFEERIDGENAKIILGKCDIIVDCTDSNSSRLALNDISLRVGRPLVYGGTESMFGQVSLIIPGKTPCLACFLSNESTEEPASVGAAVSLIASIQSAEVLKFITGVGETLAGKLFMADMMDNTYRIVDLVPRDDCGCRHS